MKYGRVDIPGPEACPPEGNLPGIEIIAAIEACSVQELFHIMESICGLNIVYVCPSTDAGPPSPADHLRKVFYRMGLSDKARRKVQIFDLRLMHRVWLTLFFCCFKIQEIVALSGAHTLGRSRPERSGWGKSSTKYTVRMSILGNVFYVYFSSLTK